MGEAMCYQQLDSPIGRLLLISDGVALTGLHMTPADEEPLPESLLVPELSLFREVREQLSAYFGGDRFEFHVPLSLRGTPFQQLVWEALQAIPYGETISYGELARLIGKPGAFRAVGAANGRNPISILIPCHRVVGARGNLGGYGGGLERKQALLSLERHFRTTRLLQA
jgi:methylated-DNA-[protein]-cysteine S-methyltransferase